MPFHWLISSRAGEAARKEIHILTPSDMDHPKGLLNLCWLMILGVRLSNMLGTVIIILRILFLTNHYFMEQHFGF